MKYIYKKQLKDLAIRLLNDSIFYKNSEFRNILTEYLNENEYTLKINLTKKALAKVIDILATEKSNFYRVFINNEKKLRITNFYGENAFKNSLNSYKNNKINHVSIKWLAYWK